MRVVSVVKDVFQFSTFFEPINLSFNQYLLKGDSPLLVHTGPVFLMEEVISSLEKELNGRPPEYVFVSHFESDECGGLSVLLLRYPELRVICSEMTARQLGGFGITNNLIIQKAGQSMKVGDFDLTFVSYPCEMHMREGLVAYEKSSRMLFSSDLFIRFGKFDVDFLRSSFSKELRSLHKDSLLPPKAAKQLKSDIRKMDVSCIAAGHGPYIKV